MSNSPSDSLHVCKADNTVGISAPSGLHGLGKLSAKAVFISTKNSYGHWKSLEIFKRKKKNPA